MTELTDYIKIETEDVIVKLIEIREEIRKSNGKMYDNRFTYDNAIRDLTNVLDRF